ncbi:unnamed protein product [Didymodactylos carnosus]|nr:unnamed protein product [Didymodactylos carnosus]CAF4395788.1 unnamed protein product [Didymodactylos carnosus]
MPISSNNCTKYLSLPECLLTKSKLYEPCGWCQILPLTTTSNKNSVISRCIEQDPCTFKILTEHEDCSNGLLIPSLRNICIEKHFLPLRIDIMEIILICHLYFPLGLLSFSVIIKFFQFCRRGNQQLINRYVRWIIDRYIFDIHWLCCQIPLSTVGLLMASDKHINNVELVDILAAIIIGVEIRHIYSRLRYYFFEYPLNHDRE